MDFNVILFYIPQTEEKEMATHYLGLFTAFWEVAEKRCTIFSLNC
jgi:hypothetical protein